MKALVTTSGFGNVHSLKSVWVEQKIEGVDVEFQRFDDSNYPSRARSMSPRLKGKIFKMLAWEEFPDYDYYIWMDSTFHMLKSKAVEYAIKSLGDADICLFNHPERSTLKQEVDYVLAKLGQQDSYISSRYDGERIAWQYDKYVSDKGFLDNKLFAAGCFIYSRRLIKNKNYNLLKEWFYHNCVWSVQDQISLPYLIDKFNTNHNVFDTGIYDNPYFQFDMRLYSAQQ